MSSDYTYTTKAIEYAKTVDNRPYNAYYERPAMLSLLPDLQGKTVLDVGSGSGWYAEYLISQGATVTTFDYDQTFVDYTKERVAGQATVLCANLAAPLAFASDKSFDLIVAPLVMHYVKDWLGPLQEFARVLRPNGLLVFSTHHPFMDWKLMNLKNYFGNQFIEDEWDVGKVYFYRRPLTKMSADLQAAGFVIERLLEPDITPEFRQARPKSVERMENNPWFIVIRARNES